MVKKKSEMSVELECANCGAKFNRLVKNLNKGRKTSLPTCSRSCAGQLTRAFNKGGWVGVQNGNYKDQIT